MWYFEERTEHPSLLCLCFCLDTSLLVYLTLFFFYVSPLSSTFNATGKSSNHQNLVIFISTDVGLFV